MPTQRNASARLAIGDIVETIRGAGFWGRIIAFDNDEASPGCTVMAIAPGFEGTKHVYPLHQLQRRPAKEATFQSRVWPWMLMCFGQEVSLDTVERGDRLVEEVFELLQSGGYDQNRIAPLRDYVWSRKIGEPHQEVGGVMVTLAAYCLAHHLDMHVAGETELARIWTKIEEIRAKQAAKPKHSPLPGPSHG
jgi:hypothetical protein